MRGAGTRPEVGMSAILDQLKAQVRGLPSEDRAELAHYLIESLESESDTDAEKGWEFELARRVAEIRSGKAVGKPADQVFAELCERFP